MIMVRDFMRERVMWKYYGVHEYLERMRDTILRVYKAVVHGEHCASWIAFLHSFVSTKCSVVLALTKQLTYMCNHHIKQQIHVKTRVHFYFFLSKSNS